MLVCLCHPTSDSEVREHARAGAATVEELGRSCGAGTGCGACHRQLGEMLEEVAEDEDGGATCGQAEKAAGADCSKRTLPVTSSRSKQSREAA